MAGPGGLGRTLIARGENSSTEFRSASPEVRVSCPNNSSHHDGLILFQEQCMYHVKFTLPGLAAFLALALACSSSPLTPSSTSSSSGSTVATANSDGSLLKVSAPAPTAPSNNITLDKGVHAAALVATASIGVFATAPLTYHFQVLKNGALAVDLPNKATSSTATGDLDFNTAYTWRVRAEASGVAGPPSSTLTVTT